MDILLLILGLALILGGANYLTDGASALAQRLRMPEFLIGLTIVAVGTSMPEMVVSVLSSINGQSAMAIGNVVGSNIFNAFLILGVCAVVRPILFTQTNIRFDIEEIRVKLTDKKRTKATNSQDIELEPALNFNSEKHFKRDYRNVLVLPKMTFPDEKCLTITVSEEQISGRTVTLTIDYHDVLNADGYSHTMD